MSDFEVHPVGTADEIVRLRAERSAMIENVRFARERAERAEAELASANRECEVRNERELGYLARAQAAEAERDALRADAERYRWLRKESVHGWNLLGHYTQDALDAAIDAAMKESSNG